MDGGPRLTLKTGVSVAHAGQALRPYLLQAGNVTSGAGNAVALRDRYLEWVEAIERQLAGITHDVRVLSLLQTPRYWHIRSLDEESARPFPLVDAELKLQTGALERLLDELESRTSRVTNAQGLPAVLDTNLLLHYLPVDQIPWPEILGSPAVRLIVPLRVIEELDAKKYSRRKDLASKARRLLPKLESLIHAPAGLGVLSSGVTLEVLAEAGPRDRSASADDEILDVALEFQQLSGRAVTVLTADVAMRVRAAALGLAVALVPDRYARASGADDAAGE